LSLKNDAVDWLLQHKKFKELEFFLLFTCTIWCSMKWYIVCEIDNFHILMSTLAHQC
jgi:hypothetical protein